MAILTPPYVPAPTMRQRKEKWVTLSNDYLSLMNLLDVDIDMLRGEAIVHGKADSFEVGEIYSLGKEAVEGVEFDKTYFRVYGIITEYKGVNLNSIIVREVEITEDGKIVEASGYSRRRKFSIPPSMCKLFGLKYSPGFELWSMASGFEKVNLKELLRENVGINYGNMSTYPTSEIDGTIRKIILELHGFSTYNSSHIITPTGAMIPTCDFVSSLTIFARQNISTDNGCAGFKIGERLPFQIVGREGSKKFAICDSKHNIYVAVDLTKKSLNANTKDGIIGVAHTALDGKDVDDVIGVKWDESSDENNKEEQKVSVSEDEVFKALNRHFAIARMTNDVHKTLEELKKSIGPVWPLW